MLIVPLFPHPIQVSFFIIFLKIILFNIAIAIVKAYNINVFPSSNLSLFINICLKYPLSLTPAYDLRSFTPYSLIKVSKSLCLLSFLAHYKFLRQACYSCTIYDLTVFGDNLTEKFNALLTFLTAMGIIVDPTTQGISDSEQAMDYDLPR
ncbi:phage holin [Bacillus sp. ATD]|uniref:phage holin n=1 Tax=Bacillus sp. ATD TaxID=3422305 RepID=UPI00207C151A